MRHSIATCFPHREQAVAGGLMSYGADITDTFRQAGNYVGHILKGEKPPIYQSSNRPSSSWLSTLRPPRRSALPSRH